MRAAESQAERKTAGTPGCQPVAAARHKCHQATCFERLPYAHAQGAKRPGQAQCAGVFAQRMPVKHVKTPVDTRIFCIEGDNAEACAHTDV